MTLMMRSVSWAVVMAMLVSTAARADDDDLLAAPVKKKPAPAKAPAKAPPAKKAPAKKAPVNNDDDLLAAPTSPTPPPPAKKGEVKTEVVVKLAKEAKRAHLFIDDKDMGALPLEPQDVTPGAHTLVVKAPAHANWTKKVTVAAGKTISEMASLEATGGLLSVASDVLGADVFVNGKSVGSTPVEDAEVPAGSAEVLVKKQGYKDGTTTASIVKGREASVTVKLVAEEPKTTTTTIVAQNGDRPVETNLTPVNGPDEATNVSTSTVKPEPITSKWYFWAGAVAVVVAVGVGVGVGVNQANQSKSLDEKAICGGKCDACIGFACSGLLPLPIGPR